MKAIFSPAGLIIIAFILLVVFFPRRPPDVTKPLRKRMRAFPEDSDDSSKDAEHRAVDENESDDAPGTG